MRKTPDADLRRRYQIVWLWGEGFRKVDIAASGAALAIPMAGVLQAFQDKGELGLVMAGWVMGTSKRPKPLSVG